MTVTLYRENRRDGAEEHDPEQLAQDFLATVRSAKHPGYESSGRMNIEFEYRWWLASPEVGSFAWEESDWPQLYNPLIELMNRDATADRAIVNWVVGVAREKRPLSQITDSDLRKRVRAFREDCEEAHAEGLHDGIPREGCPACRERT